MTATPYPLRHVSDDGRVTELGPNVEHPEFPSLVARGVMGMEWLAHRRDYSERFVGCEEPLHVIDVYSRRGITQRDWRRTEPMPNDEKQRGRGLGSGEHATPNAERQARWRKANPEKHRQNQKDYRKRKKAEQTD